jgi:hypothetical protein
MAPSATDQFAGSPVPLLARHLSIGLAVEEQLASRPTVSAAVRRVVGGRLPVQGERQDGAATTAAAVRPAGRNGD